MRLRAQLYRAAWLGLLFVVGAGLANAATVRGRLVHKNGSPAAGVTVTISNQKAGRSAPARTGADGMYYLFNLHAGAYYLEIWVQPSGPPQVYQIQVVEPNTDAPQVPVP
jgi:hypothetical protein